MLPIRPHLKHGHVFTNHHVYRVREEVRKERAKKEIAAERELQFTRSDTLPRQLELYVYRHASSAYCVKTNRTEIFF